MIPGATNANIPSLAEVMTSFGDAFGCVGKLFFIAKILLKNINDNPIIIPGIIPAKNILSTDCCAKKAKITSPIEGGIIGPTTAEQTVTAAANSALYPLSFIALISIAPKPAQSATAAPETPAKIIEERTFTCAKPALKWPTKELAKLKILSVMPTTFIRFPAIIKNGTAANEGLLTPSNICCGIIYKASEKSLVRKVINTAAPIAIDTGTLIKINKIKPAKSKINILIIILTVRGKFFRITKICFHKLHK